MLCGDLAQQTCFEHSLPIRHCAAYQRQTGEENAMRWVDAVLDEISSETDFKAFDVLKLGFFQLTAHVKF